jgi:cysteine desulfurase / selenocysteine lyase
MTPFLSTDVRLQFPGAQDQIYFNIAETGLIPRATADVARSYVADALAGTGDKALYRASVEHCRAQLARLLGAHPDEVAITKNVSEALNLFASSLTWQPGDNVVLCPELEHPNNVFLWYNLRRLKGIEVRAIEPVDGHISAEAFATAIDEHTALVTVPHVSFSPGLITDVRAIADATHAQGGLLLIDAAQSIGAIECNVEELGIDALGVATQKNLLALYGFGFLYIRRALAESLIPAHVARYGMDLGTEAGETARSGGEHLPYAPGARRFDLGNYNYLGACAAEASLQLISSIGVRRIQQHLQALAARLVQGLLELGLPVAGGPPGPSLGHIVSVGHSGGGHHDTADDPEINQLYQHLTANGVQLSIRRGVLRMSLGIYNNVADVDRTLELVREWADQNARSFAS